MRQFSGVIVAAGLLIATGCNRPVPQQPNQIEIVTQVSDLVFNVEGLT